MEHVDNIEHVDHIEHVDYIEHVDHIEQRGYVVTLISTCSCYIILRYQDGRHLGEKCKGDSTAGAVQVEENMQVKLGCYLNFRNLK